MGIRYIERGLRSFNEKKKERAMKKMWKVIFMFVPVWIFVLIIGYFVFLHLTGCGNTEHVAAPTFLPRCETVFAGAMIGVYDNKITFRSETTEPVSGFVLSGLVFGDDEEARPIEVDGISAPPRDKQAYVFFTRPSDHALVTHIDNVGVYDAKFCQLK